VVTICTASLTFNNSTSFPHSVFSVLCGSENKQRLFPYTALTDWFFTTETECVYCAVRALCLYTFQVNTRRSTATAAQGSSTRILTRYLIWPNTAWLLKSKTHSNKLKLFHIAVLQVITKLPRVTSIKSLQEKTRTETQRLVSLG
jgi:hypothetical protein